MSWNATCGAKTARKFAATRTSAAILSRCGRRKFLLVIHQQHGGRGSGNLAGQEGPAAYCSAPSRRFQKLLHGAGHVFVLDKLTAQLVGYIDRDVARPTLGRVE